MLFKLVLTVKCEYFLYKIMFEHMVRCGRLPSTSEREWNTDTAREAPEKNNTPHN